MENLNVRRLSVGALLLSLGYFVAWLCGPLLAADAGRWLGLPLWFWCSCVGAPLVLVLVLWAWLRGDHD